MDNSEKSLSDIAQELDPTVLTETKESSPLKDLLKKLNPSALISEENVTTIQAMLKKFHEIGLRTIRDYPAKHQENIVAIKMQILKVIGSENPTTDLEVQ